MDYNDLLNSHLKYGTSAEDIRSISGYENILENVVIAPWWSHDMFDNLNFKIEQVSEKVFNFYRDDVSFSYVELKQIGAPVIMEAVLPLGVTKCKNVIFIGSAGSLDKNIKIGDIVIPKYSICGDGASRYLNKDLEDEFLKREYPTKKFTNCLINVLKEEKIKYHYVPNFSIDTVIAQFYHIDKILELGAKTIEMETANFFKCNELLNVNVTALFCISDNAIVNKSLYSGRTDEENKYKYKVRYEIIPDIVVKLLKKSDYELLEFIVENMHASFLPNLTQEEFDKLVKVGIEKDKREWLWRLAFNYERSNINFDDIVEFYIKNKDGYYLAELISAVGGSLDIDKIINKIDDKDLIEDLKNRKSVISSYVSDKQYNKLISKLNK